MLDKDSLNAELIAANSKANNNDAFDFDEFLKIDNLSDFLSVSLWFFCGCFFVN